MLDRNSMHPIKNFEVYDLNKKIELLSRLFKAMYGRYYFGIGCKASLQTLDPL